MVDAGTEGSDIDAPYDGPTGITPYAAGQLVITEIMADTVGVDDESGEWFEVYNPSKTDTYDLMGCLLFDSATAVGDQDTVMGHVIVAPGAFVTLARFGDAAIGGFTPSYDYHTSLLAGGTTPDPDKDVKFSNAGDEVGLTCGVTSIDLVQFQTWTVANAVPHGRSYTLDPSHYSATENDVQGNWCTGTMSYFSTNRGTPGQPNPVCTCMIGSATAVCPF
jgi:hypothetical protein